MALFIRETGVRSSLTDGLDLYTTTGLPGGGLPTSPVSPMPDVSLSFPVFQNITGPVTFYFAVDTPNGNDTIDFDDIILNGSVGPILPVQPGLGVWVLFGTADAGASGGSGGRGGPRPCKPTFLLRKTRPRAGG